MSDQNLSSKLHAAFRELKEIGIKGAEEADLRCFGIAYTTSTEWYGEAGLALVTLLRQDWRQIPRRNRLELLDCLRTIVRVWPGFWWTWLRYRLRCLVS